MPFRNRLVRATSLVLFTAALALPLRSVAQANAGDQSMTTRVIHLGNAATDEEANQVTTALRNVIDPNIKIFLVLITHDVVVRGTPAQVEGTAKLAAELDHPKRSYRLTFTLAEFDGGHRVGVQHFATNVVVGQRVTLKQGNRVPTLTGNYTLGTNSSPQFTYTDVGVTFDSTLDQLGSGLRLRSKIEQSTATDEVTIKDIRQPTIRQATLESTTALTPGKPTNIGGVDIFGSTRHIDIEVVAEPVS